MPMLTLDDLGVLRDVRESSAGTVEVTITPTYSGCPAMATIRDDLTRSLQEHGYQVQINTQLVPAWSSDWITANGRRKLREYGYSVPGPAPVRRLGPVPLTLIAAPRRIHCPRCGSDATQLVSEFGATLCKAQYRCLKCLEPFDHVKEI
ncbi:phenylacetate-CoA oxygenase subunit PaaJ [Skermania sp. ID1734]|nr:phenylacetate-CoA oxygenase subunit PaaJ [Skermania sp. ID1734]